MEFVHVWIGRQIRILGKKSNAYFHRPSSRATSRNLSFQQGEAWIFNHEFHVSYRKLNGVCWNKYVYVNSTWSEVEIHNKRRKRKRGNIETTYTVENGLNVNLASTYMNSYGNNQDGVDTEVQNRMTQDGDPTCVHVTKFNDPRSCW